MKKLDLSDYEWDVLVKKIEEGKKFDVDEFINIKSRVSGGSVDGYVNFKTQEEIFESNLYIIDDASGQYKGNWSEMGSEVKAIRKEYTQLNKPVTSLTDGHQGIDHVFEKGGKYFIVETKYHGSSGLNKLPDGTRQMSDEWIVKDPDIPEVNRLYDAVGKDENLFNQIYQNGYERVLAQVEPNGNITYKLVDADGYVIPGTAGIFNF